jgi:dienelactone hydrolase
LFPFIASQAVRDPGLSWLRPQFRDLAAWKRRARRKLLELLQYSPARCPANAELLERTDRGDHILERVRLNTTPHNRVPAFVLIPKGAKLPAPGVVNLHDHGGFYMWGKEKLVKLPEEHRALTDFRRTCYGGKSTAVELCRRGYVVIAADMFYWGDRRMVLDDDADDWRSRPATMPPARVTEFNARSGSAAPMVNNTIQAAGFTWPGIVLWDDLRTLDYLASRPEVDAKRLACVGLSVGGFRSCHLAALDDRIRAAVVVGWMTSFPAQLRKHIRWTIGQTMLVPGLYTHMDYPDVASMAAPRAMLVINGSKDTLFAPEGVRSAFDKLSACWEKAGAPERIRTRLYDTPHEFNAQMQQEAWQWLERWLA